MFTDTNQLLSAHVEQGDPEMAQIVEKVCKGEESLRPASFIGSLDHNLIASCTRKNSVKKSSSISSLLRISHPKAFLMC